MSYNSQSSAKVDPSLKAAIQRWGSPVNQQQPMQPAAPVIQPPQEEPAVAAGNQPVASDQGDGALSEYLQVQEQFNKPTPSTQGTGQQ